MQQIAKTVGQKRTLGDLIEVVNPLRLTGDRTTRGILLYWAVLFTLGAAIIYFPGVPTQIGQSALLIAILLVGIAIQTGVALLIVIVPVRRLLIAAALINSAAAVFWIVAHVIGFPVGLTLWKPEMVTIQDFFPPVMEGLAVLLFLYVVRRRATK